MTGPPAQTPTPTDPGGIQARADGQLVEVRAYDGELVRAVTIPVAQVLVDNGVADQMKHGLRLKSGIRWLPPRFDRPSGRPDLDQLKRRNPDRYQEVWRGNRQARTGKGALGRYTIDQTVSFGRGTPSVSRELTND